MKSSQNYLDEANAIVPRINTQEAITQHAKQNSIFVDVRDGSEIEQTGTIKNAQRIPRGILEFVADHASPYHNKVLTKDAEIFLVCGAGGQAALAGKTLSEMGYTNVTNIGAFGAWKDAGGPTENT